MMNAYRGHGGETILKDSFLSAGAGRSNYAADPFATTPASTSSHSAKRKEDEDGLEKKIDAMKETIEALQKTVQQLVTLQLASSGFD